ncbi:MAG: cytoplasmic protein [Proteobacteria bacterium]|nr:MAG: cytoplasmic protein [Pseudomonadota bacterium]
MQTFLPYASFERSAAVLDPRRLGKQRVEAYQCLRALRVPGYGWRHHPAVRMWRGFDEALAAYGIAMCRAWIRAGCRDTVAGKIALELGREPRGQPALRRAGLLPPWLGSRALHRSHRSALVRKDPRWYRRHFPDVPPDLPYVWPVS